LTRRVILFLWDRSGEITHRFPPSPPEETRQLADWKDRILSGEARFFKLAPAEDRPPFAVAFHPIEDGGHVLLIVSETNLLQSFAEFKYPLLILAFAIALTGWGVIYMLTRRLTRRIQEASAAAKEIVAGNYRLELNHEHKEMEIHELMIAFKEMSERLSRQESLRTQLLAGVTHELKTPVASIIGLLQAIKDNIVTGEERERFLEVCLEDSRRLHKMVEDLLEFNRYAAQAVSVVKMPCDLQDVVSDTAARWRQGRQDAGLRVSV